MSSPNWRTLELGPGTLDELKEVIRKTIGVRRVTLAVFLTVAVAIRSFLGVSFDPTLIAAPFAWLLITFPFKSAMERRESVRALHRIHAGFFMLELLLITYLIYLLEGVEWIGVVFYLFTVIYANFFLPTPLSGAITASAIGLYAALVFLEYFGVLPHRTLFSEQGYHRLSYVVVTVLAGAAGVYATLAYTIRIFVSLLRKREQELQRLSGRLLSTQEEERRRIARELHDEIGQTLTLAQMNLDMLSRNVKHPKLGESAQLLGETVTAIRDLSHELRPPLLERLGLGPALEDLAEKFAQAEAIAVELQICGLDESREPPLPLQTEQILYRAAQEALRNSVAHADAEHVSICLALGDDRVTLTVRDDGCGLEREGREREMETGLGLLGIREQAALAGGKLGISSRPGEGTTLQLELPIEDHDP